MLRIYGQKPLFGAFVRKTWSEASEFLRTNGLFALFVRNRYFSSRLFTDNMPIFSDLSVNDSDFAKFRVR